MGSSDSRIEVEATLAEASRLIASLESDLLVTRRGTPVGVVRSLDIVKAAAAGEKLEDLTVGQVMIRPAPVIRKGASLKEVVRMVKTMGVKTVFVGDEMKVTGQVELGDLLSLMASSWEDVEVHKALSTLARLRIAELLSVRPMSVDQIAKLIQVKPITVRHHLEVLRRSGFIETEQIHGGVGRPLTLFRATNFLLGKISFRGPKS